MIAPGSVAGLKNKGLIFGLSQGVVLMTLSNLIVKAAGLFFKIPLTALIGEEGMGYFNSAYTLFTWLYMLSAAGLPGAVSMLIARIPDKKRRDGAMRIFRITAIVFTAVGLLGCSVLVLASGPISVLMRVENSRLPIIAVAPTLFFVCESAALRGYFQGLGDLRPHSVSQVVEAIGKLILGVALAYHAVMSGADIPTAAAMACVGITVGVAAGMVVLYVSFIFTKKRGELTYTEPTVPILRRLFAAALPITLSSSVMSLANIIDSFIMTRSLHASGLSQAETAAVWGNYSSLAVPMFNLPPVLTLPVAYALLPELASSLAADRTGNAVNITSKAVRHTAFFAVPCAVGLSAMSEPILSLMFAADVAERGAMLLTLLAPSSMLLCMLGLTNTVLQASGNERIPLYAMLTGAVLKLISTWVLTPYMGKYATPVSTFICYLAAMVISVGAISRCTPLGSAFSVSAFLPSLICSAVGVSAAVAVYPYVGTLASVGTAAALYFGLMAVIERRQRVKQADTESDSTGNIKKREQI